MNHSLLFEHTIELFFGDKAYQIAGQAGSRKSRREWLRKVLRLIMKSIDGLDTTPRHRQLLMANTEAVQRALGTDADPSWELVFRLFTLIGRLLGFDFHRGARCHSLAYYQTPSQHFTADLLEHGHQSQDANDKKDAVSIRRDVIVLLKEKGLSDFKVALVLNTTEHEVKTLRKGL